jgi:CheY-like chemotaxis protein
MTPFSVLLVDDQPHVLRLLTMLVAADDRLTLAGIAEDGLAAVAAARRQWPDAIVCDVQMPVMDGLQALPLLREACPASVIVMYSSEPQAAGVALDRGADLVADKAESPTWLIDRVVELCAAAAAR